MARANAVGSSPTPRLPPRRRIPPGKYTTKEPRRMFSPFFSPLRFCPPPAPAPVCVVGYPTNFLNCVLPRNLFHGETVSQPFPISWQLEEMIQQLTLEPTQLLDGGWLTVQHNRPETSLIQLSKADGFNVSYVK